MKDSQLFVGLDPSAGAENASGIAIIDKTDAVLHLGIWRRFQELTRILVPFQDKVSAIAIDGPLQPPAELDYCCFSDLPLYCHHRQTTPYKGRYAEYLLNRNGFRCFTTSRHSFARKWIRRCFELNRFLVEMNFTTIEVYPTAVRKILFPDILVSKKLIHNRIKLKEALNKTGIKFPHSHKVYSDHELDAVLAAYTAILEYRGGSIKVGNKQDGYIILPEMELKFLN